MSYINTNVSSLIAVNALTQNNQSLQTSLQRLSTGYRINSGKDDPSGLIASESLLAEQTATQTAISNAQQANNVIGTAEGALSEVSNLLVSLQGLVGNSANSAGLSQDELDANQLQVDSILSTVNRISNSSSFEGVKLLNGTFGYTTSGLTTTSAFTSISINSAKVSKGTLAVNVQVITSAQTGELDFIGSTTGLSGGGDHLRRRQPGHHSALLRQRHEELLHRLLDQPVHRLHRRPGDPFVRHQVRSSGLDGLRHQPVCQRELQQNLPR